MKITLTATNFDIAYDETEIPELDGRTASACLKSPEWRAFLLRVVNDIARARVLERIGGAPAFIELTDPRVGADDHLKQVCEGCNEPTHDGPCEPLHDMDGGYFHDPSAEQEHARKLALLDQARRTHDALGQPWGDRDDFAAFLDTDPTDLTLDAIEAVVAELAALVTTPAKALAVLQSHIDAADAEAAQTAPRRLNIIARKPKDGENEYVVVDQGERATGLRFVSATANPRSLAGGEWFWGHYFATRDEAMAHFNGRGRNV